MGLFTLTFWRQCLPAISFFVLCAGAAAVAHRLLGPAAARLAVDELREVGRFSVHTILCSAPDGAAAQPQRHMRTASVASLRLDAVLAAMLQASRTQAVQCVRSGAVAVNHVPVQSAHAEVFENDIFSVRGHGKYKLCEVGGKSRKGRTIISYFQY